MVHQIGPDPIKYIQRRVTLRSNSRILIGCFKSCDHIQPIRFLKFQRKVTLRLKYLYSIGSWSSLHLNAFTATMVSVKVQIITLLQFWVTFNVVSVTCFESKLQRSRFVIGGKAEVRFKSLSSTRSSSHVLDFEKVSDETMALRVWWPPLLLPGPGAEPGPGAWSRFEKKEFRIFWFSDFRAASWL